MDESMNKDDNNTIITEFNTKAELQYHFPNDQLCRIQHKYKK